ncbi:transcriptional regulator [Spirillospora sp. NPDC046719]
MLGPVRAWRAGTELALGPRQQRLVLAAMLARPGRPVGLGEFTGLLWDGEPPASAANAVHRYVGALRRLLEPDLPPRAPGRWLVRRADGYLLRVDASCSDLLEFRDLVGRARNAAGKDHASDAVDLFTTALDLRRGQCAAGLDPAAGAHPAFEMIEHEYTSVVCEAAGAALRCARPGAVLLVLRQAAERHPLDESLLANLSLVLAADGKQAEAMALFQETRLRLAEELGVDPGAELRAAYDRILRQEAVVVQRTGDSGDPGSPESAPAVPRPVPLAVPAQLPPDLPCFTGRRQALAHAADLVGRRDRAPRVLAVDGMPGIGKTALAVHLAHRVAVAFPDGQLYADLCGFSPMGVSADPSEVLHGFLSALGVPRQHIPVALDMRAALYRSVLAGRRVLVVLDNARDVAQVRPLLAGMGECAVVVTSRSRLTGLAAANGAHLLTLDVPSLQEAASCFTRRIDDRRPAPDLAAVEEIVERCGRLPLALAAVAARMAGTPGRPLSRMAAELRETGQSLDGFGDDDLTNGVRGAFSWSYGALSPQAARVFRLLPLHVGPEISTEAVADLARMTPRAARAALAELVRTRLVTVLERDLYGIHDLIRVYAAELGRDEAPDRAPARRVGGHRHAAAARTSPCGRRRDRTLPVPHGGE